MSRSPTIAPSSTIAPNPKNPQSLDNLLAGLNPEKPRLNFPKSSGGFNVIGDQHGAALYAQTGTPALPSKSEPTLDQRLKQIDNAEAEAFKQFPSGNKRDEAGRQVITVLAQAHVVDALRDAEAKDPSLKQNRKFQVDFKTAQDDLKDLEKAYKSALDSDVYWPADSALSDALSKAKNGGASQRDKPEPERVEPPQTESPAVPSRRGNGRNNRSNDVTPDAYEKKLLPMLHQIERERSIRNSHDNDTEFWKKVAIMADVLRSRAKNGEGFDFGLRRGEWRDAENRITINKGSAADYKSSAANSLSDIHEISPVKGDNALRGSINYALDESNKLGKFVDGAGKVIRNTPRIPGMKLPRFP